MVLIFYKYIFIALIISSIVTYFVFVNYHQQNEVQFGTKFKNNDKNLLANYSKLNTIFCMILTKKSNLAKKVGIS